MAISDLDGRIRVAAFEFLAEQTRDPRHPDNAGLRLAMQRQTPLIYLYGLVPGRYLPVWPVYIVGDDPQTLAFEVAVDDARLLHLGPRIEETLETEVVGTQLSRRGGSLHHVGCHASRSMRARICRKRIDVK